MKQAMDAIFLAWHLVGLAAAVYVILKFPRYIGRAIRDSNFDVSYRETATGLLSECRDVWDAGGEVVFRGEDGKERKAKRR